MEAEKIRKPCRSFGWAVLGFLASQLFSAAVLLTGLGMGYLFSGLDQVVKFWNTMGYQVKRIVEALVFLPNIAVGLAIRKKRKNKAFVVGWFIPAASFLLELIFFAVVAILTLVGELGAMAAKWGAGRE